MTSTPTRPVDNVVIATKGLQDRSINTQAGTTVENKGKLMLLDVIKFPHDNLPLHSFFYTIYYFILSYMTIKILAFEIYFLI